MAETDSFNFKAFIAHSQVSYSTVWMPQTGLSSLQSHSLLRVLIPGLKEAQAHPLFRARLPSSWGVLVDPAWTKTSGFWSDSLVTPSGDPAILLNPEAALDPRLGQSLLVHELTHLVHHRYRPYEENWVREGVALLAETVVTGYFYPGLSAGFEEPETSLIASTDPTRRESAYSAEQSNQYGHLIQFFYYLYRVCGQKPLLDTLLTHGSPETGIAFIDQALNVAADASENVASEPACRNFDSVFRAFQIARFVGDASEPTGYVVAGSGQQAKVRDKAPAKLLPYSAAAYLTSGKCSRPGEIPWPEESGFDGKRRCIRIRLK